MRIRTSPPQLKPCDETYNQYFIINRSVHPIKMNVTLIYNPDAGSDNQPTDDEILNLIRRAGHSAECQSSKEIGWEKALDKPVDLVAISGGDGRVGKVAKRIMGDTHSPVCL